MTVEPLAIGMEDYEAVSYDDGGDGSGRNLDREVEPIRPLYLEKAVDENQDELKSAMVLILEGAPPIASPSPSQQEKIIRWQQTAQEAVVSLLHKILSTAAGEKQTVAYRSQLEAEAQQFISRVNVSISHEAA